MNEFNLNAPSAETVFYRTYSRRKEDGTRENFEQAMLRTVNDLALVGQYTQVEYSLVREQALKQAAFPSGRAFWVAGTPWSKKQENFSGYYNCTSTHIGDLSAFGLLVDLAMQGSGTGAVLEDSVVAALPPVTTGIVRVNVIRPGIVPEGKRQENTTTQYDDYSHTLTLTVGDSRAGWRDAYQYLINAAHYDYRGEVLPAPNLNLVLDLGNVRPAGERLRGFGGTSNPIKLEEMFNKVIDLLNTVKGRQLTPVEACLLIDEAATAIVAGNIRRSAGMRQFSQSNQEAATAKLGLYSQDEAGNWRVDPKKEALRMANHTRCYHTKPSLEEVYAAVRLQFESGEGAIQYVPEAVARANADLLRTPEDKSNFLKLYVDKGRETAKYYLEVLSSRYGVPFSERELQHRIDRYGLNPCGEIIGRDFHCNLAEVHLNNIDHTDYEAQEAAFYAAGLQVAALLQHEFVHERYQYSREVDPIVGVSFTGLFDFLVHSGGYEWLKWMMEGRKGSKTSSLFDGMEQAHLGRWRTAAHQGVKDYCAKHELRVPNRITTVQPAGTKSLLTGASSGWHPPKAQRFIRRITLGINDPLVPTLLEKGFPVIPAQSARDDKGNLLDDINDPRVQEVLVEIPTEVSWANIPGCDEFDLSKLSAEAQWGLYMNVQKFYTDHNTSATIELREDEIELLADRIYDNIQDDGGYISAALLARFDVSGGTFPRLPFEPIDKVTYDKLVTIQEISSNDAKFLDILNRYDSEDYSLESITSCASAACVAKADADERKSES